MLSLHDCYRAIEKAARDRPQAANLQFAFVYAQYGLKLPDASNFAECLDQSRVQACYVRANLSGWRGPEAKAVRTALDKIITIPRRSKR